jgi:hypothetical protein
VAPTTHRFNRAPTYPPQRRFSTHRAVTPRTRHRPPRLLPPTSGNRRHLKRLRMARRPQVPKMSSSRSTASPSQAPAAPPTAPVPRLPNRRLPTAPPLAFSTHRSLKPPAAWSSRASTQCGKRISTLQIAIPVHARRRHRRPPLSASTPRRPRLRGRKDPACHS